MSTLLYIFKILFKKRHWLVVIPLVTAVIVYAMLSGQKKTYKSTTTIYTGIVSGYDILSSSSGIQDWYSVNNALDNLMSIIKSESTLENVFLKLLARNLCNIDIERDTEYMTSASSIDLAINMPNEIFSLVVKDDEDWTYENLRAYYSADRTNHLQQLFHWDDPIYSYEALSEVDVERIGNSDMIKISYENTDRYIVCNTLKIMVEEFITQYVSLRYEQTDDVVGFYEAELERIRQELTSKENSLMNYNVQNQVINYDEQTKAIVSRTSEIDMEIDGLKRTLKGSRERLALLDEKMGGASDLYKSNVDFIRQLHNISDLYAENSKTDDAVSKMQLAEQIEKESERLTNITGNISASKNTKEGLGLSDMTMEWLDAIQQEARASAEIGVLEESRKELMREYEKYSPVGSSLKQRNRDIDLTEKNYLSNLEALNEAKLRKRNLQMTSATFKILSPPVVAMTAEKTKKLLYTVICLFLVFLLLALFEIVAELFNKKPYDKPSAEKLIGAPVIGAFPMYGGKKNDDVCIEFASNQIANALVAHFDQTKSNNIINVLSIEKEEGKSFICEELYRYFDKIGTKPVFVSWHKDYDAESKYYLMASSIFDFAVNEDNMDALAEAGTTIIEYPPLSASSFPGKLLSNAAINILVVDAERKWTEMDQILFRQLRDQASQGNIVVCLNGANKDTVGTFTGLLPPYTLKHRIAFTMWNLGNK